MEVERWYEDRDSTRTSAISTRNLCTVQVELSPVSREGAGSKPCFSDKESVAMEDV